MLRRPAYTPARAHRVADGLVIPWRAGISMSLAHAREPAGGDVHHHVVRTVERGGWSVVVDTSSGSVAPGDMFDVGGMRGVVRRRCPPADVSVLQGPRPAMSVTRVGTHW